MKNSRSGFTLIEIALAVGITASAMLAIVALLPIASDSFAQATDETIVGMVLEDVHKQIEGEPLDDGTLPPKFYDRQGAFVPVASGGTFPRAPFYRAEVELLPLDPANAIDDVDRVLAARIRLFWPVDGAGGALRADAGREITYYVTTLVGRTWDAVDSDFEEKIEF